MLPSPTAGLIAALNHLLQGNDWARQRLAAYAGRQALIGIPPFQVGFVITDAGTASLVTEPFADVTISLPADTPLRIFEGFEQIIGAARVEGNAEFATELSFVFRNLRWDATEDLAQVFGDIAAQRIVNTATQFLAWQKQAAGRLSGNLTEYLRFENQTLIPRSEFEAFCTNLAQLESTLARLEQRVVSQFEQAPSCQRRLS